MNKYTKFLFVLLMCKNINLQAQTELDGVMMPKNIFCAGLTYANSSWKDYWEGSFKRNNLNLGTVSTNTTTLMGNYGITDKLNVIVGLPYIKTKATTGQLAGQAGVQDFSMYLKWIGLQKNIKNGTFSATLIGGLSTPVGNYTPDLLPLSIGLQSKTAQLRLLADYEKNNWFATVSGTYIVRGNVTLDRNTYYTTELHYSNKVRMPNATQFNIRAGYRSDVWIAEVICNKWITNGGFDISKNNMPFVSNKMNATTLGAHIKYNTKFLNGLAFLLDASTTVTGRNVGKANSIGLGVLYAFSVGRNTNTNKQEVRK